jgi:hypothetical protein
MERGATSDGRRPNRRPCCSGDNKRQVRDPRDRESGPMTSSVWCAVPRRGRAKDGLGAGQGNGILAWRSLAHIQIQMCPRRPPRPRPSLLLLVSALSLFSLPHHGPPNIPHGTRRWPSIFRRPAPQTRERALDLPQPFPDAFTVSPSLLPPPQQNTSQVSRWAGSRILDHHR